MSFDHQKDAPISNKDVQDDVIIELNLADFNVPESKTPVGERPMRLRKLVLEPGGHVQIHGHDNRPAILWVYEGTLHEYHSEHAEPRVHVAPSAIAEQGPIMHWWRNEGDVPAVIIAMDIYDPVEGGGENPEGC